MAENMQLSSNMHSFTTAPEKRHESNEQLAKDESFKLESSKSHFSNMQFTAMIDRIPVERKEQFRNSTFRNFAASKSALSKIAPLISESDITVPLNSDRLKSKSDHSTPSNIL
jgi:hypothetical protein